VAQQVIPPQETWIRGEIGRGRRSEMPALLRLWLAVACASASMRVVRGGAGCYGEACIGVAAGAFEINWIRSGDCAAAYRAEGAAAVVICQHVYTAWTTEPRPLFTTNPDDVIYVLVRRCALCGVVDEGRA